MADAIIASVEQSGIYQIRNTINGKKYIGSAVLFRRRWYTHRWALERNSHHSKHLQRAWNKYGEQAFAFEIIELCEKPQLIAREQAAFDRLGADYNSAPVAGSALGVKHSEETRRKCSERNKGNKYSVGRKMTDVCRAAISAANRKRKGYKRSATSVAATAAAHKGMKRSAETRAKIAARAIGRKRAPITAETCAKLSAALKGKQKSPEHMAALQAGRAAQVFSEERRAAVSESLRSSYIDGRRSREKTEDHKNKIGQFYAKLSDESVREIKRLRASGVTGRSLSVQFDICASTISAICSGRRYRWVSAE